MNYITGYFQRLWRCDDCQEEHSAWQVSRTEYRGAVLCPECYRVARARALRAANRHRDLWATHWPWIPVGLVWLIALIAR